MFTTRPDIAGTFGVVSSTHWLATAAAMSILDQGGNAFDAVVAGGFALQVAEPHLNGPGGEVPILLYDAKTERPLVVCGQGVAPMAASPGAYADLGLDLIPGTGLLATTVPGAFDAWMLLLRNFGTMPVDRVLGPAIRLAEQGVPALPRMAAAIAAVRDMFVREWPSSAEVFLPNGDIPRPGALFRNPALAACYRRVLAEAAAAGGGREAQIDAARRAWYQGFVADAIDDFCRRPAMDSSGRRHAGLLTGADMARWSATIEDPVTYDYHGRIVCKAGPWTQGPVFLQQLALLKGCGLEDMDPVSAEFVHTVVEAAKLAFADREAYYGDPQFVDVPLGELLSDGYADARRRQIGEEASPDLRPGRVGGRTPYIPTANVAIGPKDFDGLGIGEPTVQWDGVFKGDTSHIDVADRFGNMVAAMPSGGWLQSSPVVPGLGFPLNTRAQMFWLDPRSPSVLAPGKRPRTTLSPTLVLNAEGAYLAFGTPGGDQQDQWALTYFVRLLHHGLSLQQANDLPMFQTEHLPSSFWPRQPILRQVTLEDRFRPGTVARLRERGHEIRIVDGWSLGRLCAAEKAGPLLKASASARGMQCYAAGH